jgi:hypothetical protein
VLIVHVIVSSSRTLYFQTLSFKKMDVFWVVSPCSLITVYRRFRGACCQNNQGHEWHRYYDGGSRDFWNVGKLLPDCTAQQLRTRPSSYSLPISLSFYVLSSYHFSRTNKTTGKITGRYVLILSVCQTRRRDNSFWSKQLNNNYFQQACLHP